MKDEGLGEQLVDGETARAIGDDDRRGQLQFGIKHLFGLMTWAALASALVAWWGPGTLLTSGGLLAAWLNHCGVFARIQQGRYRAAVLWAAWAMFLASLALPSVVVFDPVMGWVAAWFALQLSFSAALEGKFAEPGFSYYLVLNAANLLALLLPLLVWRQSRGGGQWLGAALCLAMIAPWMVLWTDAMLVGYYLWCASFLVALSAIRVSRGTLLGMLAMTAGLTALLVLTGSLPTRQPTDQPPPASVSADNTRRGP
jgi:hypothetical protein